MKGKRKLMVAVLVASGIYSLANAKLFIRSVSDHDVNKLLPNIIKEIPERALYANSTTVPQIQEKLQG